MPIVERDFAVELDFQSRPYDRDVLQSDAKYLNTRAAVREHLLRKLLPVELAMLALDKRLSDYDRGKLKETAIYKGKSEPVGDGSPVLVATGYFADVAYYDDTVEYIGNSGYKARVLKQRYPLNVESIGSAVDPMMDEIEQEAKESGRQVTLVCHSVGGYKALCASLRHGDRFWSSVRQVNLMGTYFPISFINGGVGIAQEATQTVLHAKDFEMLEDMSKKYNFGNIREECITTYGNVLDPVVRGHFLGVPHKEDVSHCGLPVNVACLDGVIADLPKKPHALPVAA